MDFDFIPKVNTWVVGGAGLHSNLISNPTNRIKAQKGYFIYFTNVQHYCKAQYSNAVCLPAHPFITCVLCQNSEHIFKLFYSILAPTFSFLTHQIPSRVQLRELLQWDFLHLNALPVAQPTASKH